jgi:hypothetical protein
MEKSLIQQATELIHSDSNDIDSLKKLSIIRYDLSVEYKETNTRGSAQEAQYNWLRASSASQKIADGVPVTRAESEAKNDAETKHWHYRETNAEAQGIKQVLDCIEWFIIVCQTENKVLNATKF